MKSSAASRGAKPNGFLGAAPVHKSFAVRGCEVEPVIPKLLEDEVDELHGAFEIPWDERRLVEVEKRVGQKRVVVEEAGHLCHTSSPGAIDASMRHGHPRREEVVSALCSGKMRSGASRLVGGAQALDHEWVPACEDVVITAGPHPLLSIGEELVAQPRETGFFQGVKLDRTIEDSGPVLEIASVGDAVRPARGSPVWA